MKAVIKEVVLVVSVDEWRIILDALCQDSVERPLYRALNKLVEEFKGIRDNPLGMQPFEWEGLAETEEK